MNSYSNGRSHPSKTYPLLILLLALLVRVLAITSRPIWYDEAFSILFSEKGLGAMLYGTLAPAGAGSADIHPLGYYTLLWGWMKLFGQSPAVVRMLSITAGFAALFLVYRIADELFDPRTAETAMLAAALSPFQVHYAQEIRMYSFLALWLLLAVLAFLRGARSRDWRWWAVFAAASALAQYTHNLAAFFLVPLAVSPLFQRDWTTTRSVLLSGLTAVLFYAPWLIQLPSQFAKVDQAYWVAQPGFASLFNLLMVFTTNLPLPASWILPALGVSLLIVGVGILQTVRVQSGPVKTNGLWILYLSFTPPILLFLFSQWIPVYIERALLPSGVCFCIWLAWVFNKTDMSPAGRRMLTILLALAFGAGLFQHVTYQGFPYGPFRELMPRLRNDVQPGDLILHSNKLSMLPAMYFDRSIPQTYIGDPPGSPNDTLAAATQQVLQIEAEMDIRSATEHAERVWYIIYRQSLEEYAQTGRSTHPDLEYLNTEFSLEKQETWNDLLVLLYRKKP